MDWLASAFPFPTNEISCNFLITPTQLTTPASARLIYFPKAVNRIQPKLTPHIGTFYRIRHSATGVRQSCSCGSQSTSQSASAVLSTLGWFVENAGNLSSAGLTTFGVHFHFKSADRSAVAIYRSDHLLSTKKVLLCYHSACHLCPNIAPVIL